MSDGFAGWSTFRSGNLSPVEQIRLAARVEAAQARREAADRAAAEDLAWVASLDDQADDDAEQAEGERVDS